jgi:hypothetical protein
MAQQVRLRRITLRYLTCAPRDLRTFGDQKKCAGMRRNDATTHRVESFESAGRAF